VSYIATSCKSIFRSGKFTQELEGVWNLQTAPTKTTDAGRNTNPATTTAKISSVGTANDGTNQIIQSTSKALQAGAASAQPVTDEYKAPASTVVSITSVSGAQPVPAKPASVDGADIPTTQFQPPPVLSGKPAVNSRGVADQTRSILPSVRGNRSPTPPQGIVNDDQGT